MGWKGWKSLTSITSNPSLAPYQVSSIHYQWLYCSFPRASAPDAEHVSGSQAEIRAVRVIRWGSVFINLGKRVIRIIRALQADGAAAAARRGQDAAPQQEGEGLLRAAELVRHAGTASNEGWTKVHEDFTITEKAPTMTFALASNFTSTYCWLTPLSHSVLNVKALVGAFNQEKALVGAFSVIVQLHRLIDLRHY